MTVMIQNFGTTPVTAQYGEEWSMEVEEVTVSLAFDPLALTEDKIEARDTAARAADPSRFRPWAEVMNALRAQGI